MIAFLEGDVSLEVRGAVMLADNREVVDTITAEPTPLDRVGMIQKAVESLPYTYNSVMAFAAAIARSAGEAGEGSRYVPLVDALTACARLAAEIEADLL